MILSRRVPKQEAAVIEGGIQPEFTLPLVDQVRQVGEDVELSVTGEHWIFFHLERCPVIPHCVLIVKTWFLELLALSLDLKK